MDIAETIILELYDLNSEFIMCGVSCFKEKTYLDDQAVQDIFIEAVVNNDWDNDWGTESGFLTIRQALMELNETDDYYFVKTPLLNERDKEFIDNNYIEYSKMSNCYITFNKVNIQNARIFKISTLEDGYQ